MFTGQLVPTDWAPLPGQGAVLGSQATVQIETTQGPCRIEENVQRSVSKQLATSRMWKCSKADTLVIGMAPRREWRRAWLLGQNEAQEMLALPGSCFIET